jgi:predicted RNase H-like HicB family nuclease
MENKIREYLKKSYSRVLIPDSATGRYAAQILEFPGCFSEGKTPQQAYKNLEQAAYNWLESAIGQAMEIPEPVSAEGYSGKVALRMPKSLHRQAMNIARREGVSLNQFLVSAISAATGAMNLYRQLADRLDTAITASAEGSRLRWNFAQNPCYSVSAGEGKSHILLNLFSAAHPFKMIGVSTGVVVLDEPHEPKGIQ